MTGALLRCYHCIIKQQLNLSAMNIDTKRITKAGVVTLAIVFASLAVLGQDRYTQSGTSTITIEGTSTLHEWSMTSKEASYDAVFETSTHSEPVRLTSLAFSLPAESLRSGKSAMDKNAYNALKTDVNKQITFQLVSSKVEGKKIQCTGKLRIAGTTKQIEVDVEYNVLPGGSLQCKGSKKILMTDYKVEPPSFMFGSVTTGDEITIAFDVTLAPSKLQPVTLN
jgi:polyisoprenoid-binding protein YceI